MSSQNADRVDDRVVDGRVVEVEVGLVGEEPVPEVLLAHRVPGPVGRLGVDEDDPRVLVQLVGVGPDVEVAVRALGVAADCLEPRVLVAGVVHDEVDDHPHAALVRLVEEVAGSPRRCRSPGGRRCSRRRRTRRRAAGEGRTAGSRGSRRPATAGSRASRPGPGSHRCRRRWSRGTRGPAPRRRPRS